jgi:hypothetical protein
MPPNTNLSKEYTLKHRIITIFNSENFADLNCIATAALAICRALPFVEGRSILEDKDSKKVKEGIKILFNSVALLYQDVMVKAIEKRDLEEMKCIIKHID